MASINIAGALAPVVGNLRGTLEVNAMQTINTIKDRVKQTVIDQAKQVATLTQSNVDCATLQANAGELEKTLIELKQKRDTAIVFLQSASKRLEPVQKTVNTTKKTVTTVSSIIKILKAIPIPQAIPPGIGLPMNITIGIGDTLSFLTSTATALGDNISAIEGFTTPVQKIIQDLIDQLLKLDSIFTILDTLKLLLGALCNMAPGSVTSPADCLVPLLTLAQSSMDSKTYNKGGTLMDARNETGIHISEPIANMNATDKLTWVENFNYTIFPATGTAPGTRDLVLYLSNYYINKKSHYSSKTGENSFPTTSGTNWEILSTGKELDKAFLDLKISSTPRTCPLDVLLKQLIKNRADPETTGNKWAAAYEECLNKIKRCPIDPESKHQVLDMLYNLGNVNTELPAAGIYYKGYKLEILEDSTYKRISQRHYAVARDTAGKIVIQGTPSFSSSTDVLLAEIKFEIDNNL